MRWECGKENCEYSFGKIMNIEKAKNIDSEHVALLHREYIKTGFLSSLGLPFLVLLYRTMSNSDNAFCLVAKDNNKIV